MGRVEARIRPTPRPGFTLDLLAILGLQSSVSSSTLVNLDHPDSPVRKSAFVCDVRLWVTMVEFLAALSNIRR